MVIAIIARGVQIAAAVWKARSLVKKTVDVDYKILKAVGYRDAAARGVSHGIFAGSIGNYLKSDNGIEPDGSLQKVGNGSKANKPNQARQGRKRYGRTGNRRCVHPRSRNRYAYSRSY